MGRYYRFLTWYIIELLLIHELDIKIVLDFLELNKTSSKK